MKETVTETKSKRRIFLWILCLLSISANTTVACIHFLLLSGSRAIDIVLKVPVLDTIAEEGLHGSTIYFMLKIALHIFCIYAVILILLIKRPGFYFYSAVQVILLVIPLFFLKTLGITYLLISMGVSSVFSVLFIVLFSFYLPQRQTDNATDQQ
jgi:hypothetical protein